MTKEEKKLLLTDLCARLPYGVKIDGEWIAPMSGSPEHSIEEFDTFDIDVIKTSIELGEEGDCRDGKMQGLTICDDGKNHFVRGYMCKPYLRPLSSMTEEEKIELKYKTCPEGTGYFDEKALICPGNHYGEYIPYNFMSVILNWLLAHHFDVRNLIEKELALEAPKDMYKIE